MKDKEELTLGEHWFLQCQDMTLGEHLQCQEEEEE